MAISTTWTEPETSDVAPTVEATLNVLDDAATLKGILSRDGRAATFDLARQSGARASLDAPEQDVAFALPPDASPLMQLEVSKLTLTAVDDDSDGVADRITGAGDGGIVQSCGDCSYTRAVSLTLTGTPDQTPPRLNLPRAPVNPIDVLTITSSEALESATLSLGGTKAIPLSGSADQTWPTSLSTTEVLPFAGSWSVTGTAQDFAGLPLDLSGRFSTLADPGIFAQDGFETAPNVALVGAAELVDQESGLPIPSGGHALLLPMGTSATFHLKRATANATSVSARIVELRTANAYGIFATFQSAVIGGTERIGEYPYSDAPTSPTRATTWTRATEPRTLQFALKDAGDDVIVKIAVPECFDFCGGSAGALLVDELKIE